jgi:ATP-dependent RNA helicase DeaD
METFRIEVGSTHGIKPSNVVGAIANEAGIEGVHIGRVDIREDHSFVDLPEGMPKQIFKVLQKVLVAGRELRISKAGEESSGPHLGGPRQAGPHPGGLRQVGPHQAGAGQAKPARDSERKMLSRRITPARKKRD